MRIVTMLGALAVLSATPPAHAAVDLVINKIDIQVHKDQVNDRTDVSVTVHNNGDTPSGGFTLRIGVAKWIAGNPQKDDRPNEIVVLLAGGQITKIETFNGTDWTCAEGTADTQKEVNETSENNNHANVNNIAIYVGEFGLDTGIALTNPYATTSTLALSASPPPGWSVDFETTEVVLAPEGLVGVGLHITQPPGFTGMATILVLAAIDGGTAGITDWEFEAQSPVAVDERTWARVKNLYR